MIAPTPHCSPCSAFPGAIRSSIWENICSEPDAGLVVPATLIATPETIMHLTACQTASSSPDLMSSAFSMRSFDAVFESDAAKVLNSSFFNRCASSQSLIADRLDMTSAHPEASIR